MRYGTSLLISLFILALANPADAEVVPFSGVLEITASVGTFPDSFQLLSVDVTGAAEISGGMVRIRAGAFSAVVPRLSGFGGTLVDGATVNGPIGTVAAGTFFTRMRRAPPLRLESAGTRDARVYHRQEAPLIVSRRTLRSWRWVTLTRGARLGSLNGRGSRTTSPTG